MSRNTIWTTKDGKKIPVTEMTNPHLLNTHRFVNDRLIEVENFQHNAYIFAPSEDTIAYDDFEAALEDSYEVHGDIAVLVNIFVGEIQKRGLEPLEPRVKVDKLKVKSEDVTIHKITEEEWFEENDGVGEDI